MAADRLAYLGAMKRACEWLISVDTLLTPHAATRAHLDYLQLIRWERVDLQQRLAEAKADLVGAALRASLGENP